MADTAGGTTERTAGYRRLVLTLLVVAYTLNFVDRTIIASIGQAIKADLKITDTQLGLLGGLYFALLYTMLGIPLARLAERASRVNIIAGAILLWSAFTALCGSAGSYATLAAYRFGVGVGEAGLSPPAHSLLSDHYPPERRASALSIYSLGVPIGSLVGAVVGTWLAQHYSWRVAFMAVGLPGVLVALAIRTLVKEPARGGSEPGAPVMVAPPPASFAHELRETAAVAKLLLGQWPVLNVVIGVTLLSFAGYGGGQFIIPYFIRAFGLSLLQAGAIVGVVGAGSQMIGVVLGGPVADRLARGGSARWYGLVPASGALLAYPFLVGVFTAATWRAAAVWLAFPGIFAYAYMGPTYGVVQNAVPPARRATATAVLLLVLNLFALGGGPPITGWLIDHLAAFHFAHVDMPGFGSGVAGLWGADAGAFGVACPGGVAPAGGAAARDVACKAAVLLATRQGELLAYGVALWGALHYVIASFGLSEAMAAARRARGEAA